MDNETKFALKKAIKEALPVFHVLSGQFFETKLSWSKCNNGWQGKYTQSPDFSQIYSLANSHLSQVISAFDVLFRKNYPAYFKAFVCYGGLGFNLDQDKTLFVSSAISDLWERHGTFECSEAEVDAIVNDCADFTERTTMPVCYQAHLLNFQMDSESLPLLDGLIIRKLSDNEISNIYGGSLMSRSALLLQHTMMHECVIEQVFEEDIVFQAPQLSNEVRNQFEKKVDKVILALRTFKQAPIGCGEVRARCLKFSPHRVGLTTFRHEYVPFGAYQITSVEIEGLLQHVKWISTLCDVSMETACFRLASATTRLRAQDQIVDAVIGMEALLLAGLRPEDRRGELKFRFSLHYSTLFGSAEERHSQFKIAKHLYDLRSTIAHGGDVGDKPLRIGEEKLSLTDAGNRSCAVLRHIIHHFLPEAQAAPYKKPEFWERAYFGL